MAWVVVPLSTVKVVGEPTAERMPDSAVPAEVRAKIEAQIPLGRLGRPEEIAHAVAFLTGEETGWMTGANLAINGGQYMGW